MLKNFQKVFGPGILFACTAIGVSHLVQSTRAGAMYGFALMGLILLTNLMKYPFFEFGSRYTLAKGENILHGYHKKGKIWLYLYMLITVLTMFTVTGTVSFFTGSLFLNLVPIPVSPIIATLFLLIFSSILVGLGKFKGLDITLKALAAILVFSTFTAFVILVSSKAPPVASQAPTISWSNKTDIVFVIALMGWMPTALDLSAWSSIWTQKKMAQTGYRPQLRQVQLDFAIGYGISALLAICFLTFGAYMFWGNTESLPDQGVPFAKKIIEIFNVQFGPWSYYLIGIAAFSTMLSTTITVVDGYSSAIKECMLLLGGNNNTSSNRSFWIIVLVLLSGSMALITLLSGSLSLMVTIATVLSFLVAPVIAWMNYSLVTSPEMDISFRPGTAMKVLSWSGLVFLWGFTLFYLYSLFL